MTKVQRILRSAELLERFRRLYVNNELRRKQIARAFGVEWKVLWKVARRQGWPRRRPGPKRRWVSDETEMNGR